MGDREHRRVITHDRVVQAGISHFLHRSTLDMAALAGELAVSRATLYRVAGSREALLGDVLRTITELMLSESRAARTRSGMDGVIEVSRHFSEQFRSPVMKNFLKNDPEAAAHLLFTPSGGVHESAVAAQLAIFSEAGLCPVGDSAQLAYLYVRTVGTFLFAEFFTGHRAGFDDLVPALRLLLSTRTTAAASLAEAEALHAAVDGQ